MRAVHRHHLRRGRFGGHANRRHEQRRPTSPTTDGYRIGSTGKTGFGHPNHHFPNGSVQMGAQPSCPISQPHITIDKDHVRSRAALQDAEQTGQLAAVELARLVRGYRWERCNGLVVRRPARPPAEPQAGRDRTHGAVIDIHTSDQNLLNR